MKMELENKRIKVFDFWKGICILFVIITHSAWTDEERLRYLFPLYIEMAVPLFMIITGYLNAKSFHKNNVNTLEMAYEKNQIKRKFLKYSVPYLCVWGLESILFLVKKITFKEWVLSVFVGGYGPGSYYYPVLIQLIFIYPIIYFIVVKYKEKGMYGVLLGELLCEIIKIPWNIAASTYRLMILRYIPLLAFGTYIYLYGKEKLKPVFLYVCGGLGFAFIAATQYWGYKPQILFWWTGTSSLATLFIWPLFYLIMKKQDLFHNKVLELIGRNSYHIYLIQMVYFYFGIPGYLSILAEGKWIVCINILVCVIGGIVFAFVNSDSLTKIMEKHRKCRNKQV